MTRDTITLIRTSSHQEISNQNINVESIAERELKMSKQSVRKMKSRCSNEPK
jgi:hypothetical protein